MTDETLEQIPERDAILKAIDDLGKSLTERIDNLNERVDNLEKSNNIQFEAIRRGIAENSAAFDRFEAKFLLLRADFKDMYEEIRQMKRETLV